jgi:hypothetical protein
MAELPIVTFGKYKDKPVTELLADDKYVEWLKQQSWFTNQKPIYNIVVNQQINQPNLNSKTPEHNSLQNKFLDENNRIKLLKKVINTDELKEYEKLKHLLNNENFIKNFGNYDINKLFNPEYECDYEFEGKFNWDLIIKSKPIIYYEHEFIINDITIKSQLKKEYDLRNELKLDKLNKLKLREETDGYSSIFDYKHEISVYNLDFNREYYKYIKEIFSSCGYWIDNNNNVFTDINDKGIVKLCSKDYISPIYCEIKPLLSDDYPTVLRKIKTQITLMGKNCSGLYVLILKEFVSNTVSKDQLIQIFNNSDIHVIFTDKIFDDEINNNILTINNSDSKLVDDLKSELEKQKLLINELKIENEKLKKDIQKLKKK